MILKNSIMKLFLKYLRDVSITTIGVLLALFVRYKYELSADNKTANNYVVSLKEDLVQDTLNLNSTMEELSSTSLGLDSALEYLQMPLKTPDAIKLTYVSMMKYDWFPPKMDFNERTISQLKYKGDLRLITNKEVAENIALYDLGKNFCNSKIMYLSSAYSETFHTEKYVYNYKYRLDIKDKMDISSVDVKKIPNETLMNLMDDKIAMATQDKEKIIACYNDFANYNASLTLYSTELEKQKIITIKLINLLVKEYNIK